MKGNTIRAEH